MKRKRRLLLLEPHWRFLNRTQEAFFDALSGPFEIVRYGPGYVDMNSMAMSVLDVVREVGGADAVLIDELLLFKILNPEKYRAQAKINKFYFDLRQYSHTRSAFPLDLERLDIPLFASLLRSDYYNFPHSYIEILQETGAYAICWGPDFILPRDQLPNLNQEWFGGRVKDHFAEFVQRSDRVVEMLHCVDESEILPWHEKRHEWCIPGARYYRRRQMAAALRARGIGYVSASPLNFAFQVLERMGLLYRTHYDLTMSLSYNSFRQMIARSWRTFTCGSALRWPIRKFFEIPAFGSLLICEPCAGFEKLGFVNGESCLVGDVDEIVARTRDRSRMRQMIAAGQAVVRQRHTAQVRARQLSEWMESKLNWKGD